MSRHELSKVRKRELSSAQRVQSSLGAFSVSSEQLTEVSWEVFICAYRLGSRFPDVIALSRVIEPKQFADEKPGERVTAKWDKKVFEEEIVQISGMYV